MTMTPFSNNGTIRQEDIQSRNITRQRIAQAIAQEAQRTELLVTLLIDRVGKNRLNSKSVDNLWNDIQMDGQLKAIRLKADANVSDYPNFSGWLNGQRIRIERTQKARLADSMNTRIYQRRFANTVGFHPAFA
jgi:hypothetical protein